ncbi:hypothetical protein Y032_0116g576 [Ancylostoma ceylanicum]|uniref:VWFA domain-containing protein n=1 Tax=Ancylostoma ceylanicum TaxID=53326 RepID=A0A016TBJ2_9BILA|nr:hypothetical protein Y032_0116g576 [Ancylostoma ceylanicum]
MIPVSWCGSPDFVPKLKNERTQKCTVTATRMRSIHDLGIQVVLIAVGSDVLNPRTYAYLNAMTIAGGRENMIAARSFQSFDTNVLQKVLKELCRVVY